MNNYGRTYKVTMFEAKPYGYDLHTNVPIGLTDKELLAIKKRMEYSLNGHINITPNILSGSLLIEINKKGE